MDEEDEDIEDEDKEDSEEEEEEGEDESASESVATEAGTSSDEEGKKTMSTTSISKEGHLVNEKYRG